MSDLFLDMHRRCCNQNSLNTSASATTITKTTSKLSSSTQHINEQIFSHHNKCSTADGKDVAHDDNCEDDNYYEDNDDDDAFANMLSLKLRKPKHWKWELSTSKSCSNIALPRILLYDHKDKLLIDAQGDMEGVYKQGDHELYEICSHQSNQPQLACHQQLTSTSLDLTHSIRKAVEKEFNCLQIQEATPSPEPYLTKSNGLHCSRKAIDLNTTDLPDYGLSRRSSSSKGVRFNVKDDSDFPLYESQIPEFLPTPPSTITTTSSSSGPREKRKYRRSHSSGRSSANSESILERFSYQKGRFSSPEYTEENGVRQSPRYFLRTCKAGTLVVKEDSFIQHPRRRRRPLKNHSNESLQSTKNTLLSSLTSKRKQLTCNSPTMKDTSCNKKQQSIDHRLSDGNVLLNKQLSSTEEDETIAVDQKRLQNNINSKHLRKYAQARNQTKDLNFTADVHQNGKVR